MKTPPASALTPRPTPKAAHVTDALASLELVTPKEKVSKGLQVRFNTEIPEEMHAALKMKALQEKRSLRDVVLSLIEDYLKK